MPEKPLTVRVPARFRKFVESQQSKRGLASPGDVIARALRMYRDEEIERERFLNSVRESIGRSRTQIAAGERFEVDASNLARFQTFVRTEGRKRSATPRRKAS